MGIESGVVTMENIVEALQKIESITTIWSNDFTSVYLHKENENTTLKRYLHHQFHCIIIYNSQNRETT